MRLLVLVAVCCAFKLSQTQVNSCWSSPITEKYKTDVQELREKLKEAYTDLNERQTSAQSLLKNMVVAVKIENNKRIKNLKNVVSKSKPYRGGSYVVTRNCVQQQNIEMTKLYNRNNALECLPNQNDVNALYNIKGNILKLEKVTSVLINFCQYLNPLERESNYLNICITNKIRHINLQIPIIEMEFKTQINNVLNSVKRCVSEESNNIGRNLNVVSSNLHKCNLV